ncbi:MAG: hypothetical protein M3065_17685 [Actinomycetota bacterium]|nr:hypothetical protein [Actinomycetota bacterium]
MADTKLDVSLGKWINAGHPVARHDIAEAEILTSDIYEWAPGAPPLSAMTARHADCVP